MNNPGLGLDGLEDGLLLDVEMDGMPHRPALSDQYDRRRNESGTTTRKYREYSG